MDFFLFGPDHRRLFGCLHEGAAGGASRGTAVLLCPPWGQEGIRTQRMLRVAAERLARAGVTVLRFDYHGTGDSPGADEEFDLQGGAEDLLEAHQHLGHLAVGRRLVWIGVRLGATLALKALAQGRPSLVPDHLIAWEPVCDGGAYTEALRVKHVEALEATYTWKDPAWRRALQDEPESFRQEAMGFGLSDAFRAELEALTLEALCRPGMGRRLSMLMPTDASNPAASSSDLRGAFDRCEAITLDHQFDWSSEEALNTALVPGQAVQRLYDLAMAA